MSAVVRFILKLDVTKRFISYFMSGDFVLPANLKNENISWLRRADCVDGQLHRISTPAPGLEVAPGARPTSAMLRA